MLNPASRRNPRCFIRLALAGMATLATAHGASAEDGIGGFLSSIFGGQAPVSQAAPPPQAAPASRYASSYARRYQYAPRYQASSAPYRRLPARPLIVRLHQAKPKLLLAQSPIKPGTVPIYEDKTLRRGDAVMTADGVRIFAGSISWPYAAGDFVALAKAKDLNKDTVKVLTEMNRLPRG